MVDGVGCGVWIEWFTRNPEPASREQVTSPCEMDLSLGKQLPSSFLLLSSLEFSDAKVYQP